MKYLKKYENINFNLYDLKIGNYVIAKTKIDHRTYEKLFNRIGIIKRIKNSKVLVDFDFRENVDHITFHNVDIRGDKNGNKIRLWLDYNNLLYWSDNKEELEQLILTNKYNL